MGEPAKMVDQLAYAVIGAAIEVHRILGPGFLEAVYEEALCIELNLRAIPHCNQYPVSTKYKNNIIGEGRIDLLVDNILIVELKAVEMLNPVHTAQVISYLRMTGLSLGLLINFNVPILKVGGIKRIILSENQKL